MKITMPKQAAAIIGQLNQAGFEAFAVGGCVRDSLLGRVPGDWDITTNALPAQVKQIFHKTVDTGIAHGTVTVLLQGMACEVTTYRIDGDYEDHRHPKEVRFTGRLEEDLGRRDFTINAMAYSDRTGLVDCFSGKADLEKKIIRCVGNPACRFEEDALRILRAFRFASQLEFEIEPGTRRAAEAICGSLRMISMERITAELIKLLTGRRPELLADLHRMGVTEIFYPQLAEATPYLLRSLAAAAPEKQARLAALFAAEAEETAAAVLKTLKLDNETIRTVSVMVRHRDDPIPGEKAQIRKILFLYGEALTDRIFANMRVKAEALADKDALRKLDRAEALCREIIADGDCVSYRTLALNGRDLLSMGMASGKEVGDALAFLMDAVLQDPGLNQKDRLRALLSGRKPDKA